jgi:hypothetical protein
MLGSDPPESADLENAKIVGLPVPDADKRNILSATAETVFGGGN